LGAPHGRKPVPVSSQVIERLKNISSGTLTTQLFKHGLKQCFLVGLKPLNPNCAKFAGEAYTMRFIPTREDIDTYATLTPFSNPDNLQWDAVDQIGPGQVLVIDSRNDTRAASAGNMLLTHMMVKGVAGIVTDGSLRDGQEISRMAIPAYAREVTASTRLSYHHAADLQVPISCAEVAVYPGDIIVGDGDGITVVPRHLAAQLADDGEKQDAFEAYLAMRMAAGEKLYGLYPPNDQTRADYQAWIKQGSDPARAVDIRAEKISG
jgi:regulator of RNase E activity RraA